MEIGVLVVGAGEQDCDRDVALGRNGESSGASPTTTRSMMRGGFASRSMTLTVSTLPSEAPALPLSEVSAILPLGATATL
jgi:hypothetical protein